MRKSRLMGQGSVTAHPSTIHHPNLSSENVPPARTGETLRDIEPRVCNDRAAVMMNNRGITQAAPGGAGVPSIIPPFANDRAPPHADARRPLPNCRGASAGLAVWGHVTGDESEGEESTGVPAPAVLSAGWEADAL